MTKTILHLCADIGSDSYFYQQDPEYNVIIIGKDIGVENYIPPKDVYGIIANPVCTEFSTAKGFHKDKHEEQHLDMVKHCQRIIKECNPQFWVIENPATGTMKDYLGKPDVIYQPWEYGSPWTKKTALWGKFFIPTPTYHRWGDVPKNDKLYVRPGRSKPSLAFLHKSAIHNIEEFKNFTVEDDMSFRSLCSQGFAKAFYEANK